MNTPHQPLTPEERALAQSLSRLGPHGGPSPDLDARILGAARAAVQAAPAKGGGTLPPPRRRWPLGMGVAASVLLAAGIAWQLRPSQEVPMASEAPADAQESVAWTSPDAAGDAAAPVEAAPAVVAVEPPPVGSLAAPPADAERIPPPPSPPPPSGPARKNAEAAARQEAPPKRSPLALIPSPPALSAPAEPAAVEVRAPTPQAFPAAEDAAPAMDEAPAERARAQAAQRAAAEQQQEQRVRYESERREATAKTANTRALQDVTVTGSRVQTRNGILAAQDAVPASAPAAPPAPPPPAASAGSVQPSAARNALRRTDLQVPVDEDTRLPPEEWLERIRLRRDLGDSANALRSLQLFVQEHPFQRVPDDLRPLLGTP